MDAGIVTKNQKHCTDIGIGIAINTATGKRCAIVGLGISKDRGKRIGVDIDIGSATNTSASAGKHCSQNINGLHVRLAGPLVPWVA